jgi:hypothetical protein
LPFAVARIASAFFIAALASLLGRTRLGFSLVFSCAGTTATHVETIAMAHATHV